MDDLIEKVKNGLRCCLGYGKCTACGYRKSGYSDMDCRRPLLNNSLSVIEQMEKTINAQQSDLAETLNVVNEQGEEIERLKSGGTYECFHCGSRSVIWGADFSFEDYGREGEGIVHTLHCDNCGAEIEYYIPTGEDEE